MTSSQPARRATLLAGAGALVVMVAHAFAAMPAVHAQGNLPSVSGATAPTHKPAVRVAQATKSEAKPTWNELNAEQQKALLPLAASWGQLSEAHKRKWIALSQNYRTMPPAEQARLHSRMAEWAAMSPQQRTQARLNFAETQKLPPTTDKKAKWEAYQALSPEEKRKLAGAAKAKPAAPSTAAAVQPVPQQKLAKVPKPKRDDARAPRIAGLPHQVDHNTLLPQPGAFADNP